MDFDQNNPKSWQELNVCAENYKEMGIKKKVLKTGETRVWRTYGGGAALDRWHGREGENGMFPEDWAASTTRASNPGREDIVEGLSRVISMDGAPYLTDVIAEDPQAFFGAAHLKAFGEKAGFLVKLIDAGERLTIQVHPDKQYAKEMPVDLLLLSPAISAYSAAQSVPVSRLRSTCQPVDQHLLTS